MECELLAWLKHTTSLKLTVGTRSCQAGVSDDRVLHPGPQTLAVRVVASSWVRLPLSKMIGLPGTRGPGIVQQLVLGGKAR